MINRYLLDAAPGSVTSDAASVSALFLSCQMVKHVHQSVAKESLEFLSAVRRYNYVTPTSFLEVLSTYRNVLTMKRIEVGTLKDRLQVRAFGYPPQERVAVPHQLPRHGQE